MIVHLIEYSVPRQNHFDLQFHTVHLASQKHCSQLTIENPNDELATKWDAT